MLASGLQQSQHYSRRNLGEKQGRGSEGQDSHHVSPRGCGKSGKSQRARPPEHRSLCLLARGWEAPGGLCWEVHAWLEVSELTQLNTPTWEASLC